MGCSYSRWDVRDCGAAVSAVQHLVDTLGVGSGHLGSTGQPAGAGGRLVLHEVATVGLLPHDLSGAGATEPLCSAAVGLRLGHVSSVLVSGSVVGFGLARRGVPGRCGGDRACAGLLGRLGAGLRAAVRGPHHRHVAAVLLGGARADPVLGDAGAQSLQQSVTQLRPRLLTAAEHDRHLDLGPGFQEADHVALLRLVVVVVDLGAQLLFLDDGLLLVLARLTRLLCRLVLVLAVVHDLADRRSGVGGHLDKVEIGIRGDAKRIFDAHDAYLLPTRTDQTDLRYANALVDADLSADGTSLGSLSVAAAAVLVRTQRQRKPPTSKKA